MRQKPIEFYGTMTLGCLCLLISVAAFVLGILHNVVLHSITDYLEVGYFFFSGIYLTCFPTILLRRRVATILKKNPSTVAPVVLHCSSERLDFQGNNEAMQFGWSKYTKFLESKNLFLLYWSPKTFQLVPKRSFANQFDLEQFRAWSSGIGQKDAPPIAPIPQP